jgi:DivIVA domain-containing protein
MTLVYVLLCALVVGAVAFGVAVLVTGADPGLAPEEPEGSSVPLPADRPLAERDFQTVRFDTGLRGYRMAQVDVALRRAAYDVGYKEELVAVLEAEVTALRAGRRADADALRQARLAALGSGGHGVGEDGADELGEHGAGEFGADEHGADEHGADDLADGVGDASPVGEVDRVPAEDETGEEVAATAADDDGEPPGGAGPGRAVTDGAGPGRAVTDGADAAGESVSGSRASAVGDRS